MAEKREYYMSRRATEPITVKVADVINPWEKGTPAHAIIDQIYRATSKEEGLTLEELAESVGWSRDQAYRVYYIIMATRYMVNWIIASDYIVTGRRPDSIKWVYFRAVKKEDQRRYLRKRIQDHIVRGYHISYLIALSDLTEEEVRELIEETETLVEEVMPFIEEEVKQ